MFLFNSGAESSMLEMGQTIGSSISKSRKLILFIVSTLVLSFLVTIAEPDLIVFAGQVMEKSKWLFVLSIGLGVGVLSAIAILRIIFQIKISHIFLVSLIIIIILMLLVPKNFISIAFDVSGVTTGPISSPFLLAFGLGITAVRASNSQEESFGVIGISSMGPIFIILFMGLFSRLSPTSAETYQTISSTSGALEILSSFGGTFLKYLKEIIIVIGSILIIFLIFNNRMLKLPKSRLIKILIGLGYTYIGIVLYLTGVSVGYLKISSIIGFNLFKTGGLLLMIPIVIFLAFSSVAAEPAVQVLNKKVYEITGGVISKKIMYISISISVMIALIIYLFKIYFNIPFIYIILPICIITTLLLLLAPQIFIAIAFDSGGVASGPMSTSFLLPIMSGFALALQPSADSALGVIAIISTMPLITLQVIGIIFKIVKKRKLQKDKSKTKKIKVEIINFGE